jgi:hypothetical protein
MPNTENALTAMHQVREQLDAMERALRHDPFGPELPEYASARSLAPWLLVAAMRVACEASNEPMRAISYALGVTSQQFELTRVTDDE